MPDQPLDCRSAEGITVGGIDAIITLARLLADRPLVGTHVRDALADFATDEDVARLLGAADRADPTLGSRLVDCRAQLQRQTDLVAELRRHLEARDQYVDRLLAARDGRKADVIGTVRITRTPGGPDA